MEKSKKFYQCECEISFITEEDYKKHKEICGKIGKERFDTKIKKQKGFIQIPILIAIIVSALFVGGTGYIGVKKYQNYKFEKIEKERLAVEEKNRKDEEIVRLQKEKEFLEEKEKNKQSSEIEELKKEVRVLKKKEPQIIQQTIIKEIPAPVSMVISDLPSIIKQWRPRIAYIACEWRYSNGEISARGSGSGLLTNTTDIKDGSMTVILTSGHVIFKDDKYKPAVCDISLPGISNSFRVTEGETPDPFRKANSGLDWGTIRLNFSNDYMKLLAEPGLSLCKESASVGDDIVILGYPGIGSQTDITATEGIISGHDGNYYITSAKVEHGNSGGVAISRKDNCYLGIPTFAKTGDVESLARILDAQTILENL